MPSTINAQHLTFLLLWSGIGLVLSLFLYRRGEHYFAEYTTFWSLVTLGTYLGLRLWLGDLEHGALLNTTRSALLYSLGLDTALYPLAGGWMFSWGRSTANPRGAPYGIAMWAQGVVHIGNSLTWLSRLL